MEKIPFNTEWECISNTDITGERSMRKVSLPDDFIIDTSRTPMAVSGAFSGYYSGGSAMYIKRFALPAEWKGKTVILYIDGAYMRSNVSINHEYIRSNMYGYSPFTADLTPWLRENNILRVETVNHQPNSRWYTGGGMYRQAYILLGGDFYLPPEDVFVTTPALTDTAATVQVAFGVKNTTEAEAKVNVSVQLFFNGKPVCEQEISLGVGAGELSKDNILLEINQPKLWDTDTPDLYTAILKIKKEGAILDEHEQTFGIRRFEFDSKNGMRLNGKPVKLRGGCIHHDYGMLGASAYPAAEERKIRILKNLGYNAIRTAHNPPSSTFLDICDRVGMLVLEEAFDCWTRGKRGNDYHLHFRDWWERDLSAMLLRDRNHPCVFCWSIGNEIDEFAGSEEGLKITKQLADYVRSIDSTRPVTLGQHGVIQYERAGISRKDYDFAKFQAQITEHPGVIDGVDYWGTQTERHYAQLDIAGYNYIWPRYKTDAQKYPDRVIMSTESHPLSMYDYWQAALENPNCIGDFIWTAFDNTGEAGTGRVTYDEEDNKFFGPYPWLSNSQGDVALDGTRRPQSYYHTVLWGIDDGIHLFSYHPSKYGKWSWGTGWHWNDVQHEWSFEEEYLGKPVTVEAYADCDKVEFILNGTIAGETVPEKYIAKADILYEPGTLEAVAYKNGAEVARDKIETTGAPSKIVLTAEKTHIDADGLDLAFIRAEIYDSEGRLVTNTDTEIAASIAGGGRLWLGSGNPCTDENYGTGKRRTWQGSVIIAVGATYEACEIELCVSADGMNDTKITIICE